MGNARDSGGRTLTTRGTCRVCGFRVALRKDGSAMNHLLYGIRFGGSAVHCKGGGRAPLALGEQAVWESPRDL